MKIPAILFFSLFFCLTKTLAQQKVASPVTYYREQGDTYEQIFELPHDTIVTCDTVFISDIDGFLAQYGCTLGSFAKKYGSLKRMIDSLNNLSGERLFYNYFLPRDHGYRLSSRFIVKSFRLKKGRLVTDEEAFTDDVAYNKFVRKEILVTCEGADHTDQFLKNPTAIIQTISDLFTQMQRLNTNDSTKIKGINLYFPDYTFREKRAMVQFVKSVRIMMDASRDFKSLQTRLNVTFLKSNGIASVDKGFLYSLIQEAREVICLNENTIDSCYVKGNSIKSGEKMDVGLIPQILSHFYIARYYTDSLDITKGELTDFSIKKITPYLQADYLENTWESFFFLLIVNILVVIVVVVLYYSSLPVSSFMNKYTETVLMIAMMLLLELVALVLATFQHMCQDDGFSLAERYPILIFSLPLLVVLIIPLLKGIFGKRRIP